MPAVAVWLLSVLPVCFVVTMVLAESAVIGAPAGVVRAAAIAGNGRIYDGYEISNGNLHGLAGWKGVDIAAGCGAEIYAPFDGRVTYNGLDGHDTSKGQATMLTVSGSGVEVTLLHGDYLPGAGTAVSAGEVIGHENKWGYTEGPTGCHSHVILREGGQTLNYLDWLRGQPLLVAQAGRSPVEIRRMIQAAAMSNVIDPIWFDAQIRHESGYNPTAKGNSGEEGLGQLMPVIKNWCGLTDAFDPTANLDCSARFMAYLLDKYNGNIDLALAAYNAGEPAVDRCRCVPNNGVTPGYVSTIRDYYSQLKVKE